MHTKPRMTKGLSVFLIYLALALATFAIYWQVRDYEFVNLDDDYYIFNNPHVKAGLTGEGFFWAFSLKESIDLTGTWHPLTWLSHMLDCEVYGLAAGGHHLTSVLFHIVNSLLVLLAFKRMTGKLWPSVFIAGVFALHPLRVESVAWVSERKDVLSTMFWLLTIIAYTSYARRPGAGRYILTVLAFILGLLSKHMLVTLPFVLLLLDYWPLERFSFGKSVVETNQQGTTASASRSWLWILCRLVVEKIPFFVLSAIACIISYHAQQVGGAVATMINVPLKLRIFNAVVSYVKYLEKFIFPTRLCAYYPLKLHNLSLFQAMACMTLLIVISLAVICMSRRRYLLVGWFWYLGSLVPVIGLVQIGSQAMADRYSYVPHIGLFIIVAWGIPELLSRLRYQKVILSVFSIVVLLVLGVMSWYQVRTWQNSTILFKHAINVVEDNWYAHGSLSYTLENNKEYDEAIKHYKEVLRIRPDFLAAQNGIGRVLIKQGKIDEAIELYQQILPEIPDTNESPGIRPVKYSKEDEIMRIYIAAHVNFGVSLEQKGMFDEAIRHYAEALRIKPNHFFARWRVGALLAAQGKIDEAIKEFRIVLANRPEDAEVHYTIGVLLQRQGKISEAIAEFREAVRLNPDYTSAKEHLKDALGQPVKEEPIPLERVK